jgi:hypothetical protein
MRFFYRNFLFIPIIAFAALSSDYPELGWLSQKGGAEFDRTVMSIHALDVFLRGKYEDYLEFVSRQPKGTQLEWQSFLAIQNHMHSVLSSYKKISESNLEKLLEFALIFRDAATSQATSDRISSVLGKACFQSDLLSHFNEFGKEIFPSYDRFSTQERELISDWVGLINYEEVSRLEGGPEMFAKLKASDLLTKDPLSFEMSMFLYICQVAGAMAHIDQKSSLTYNEDMHQTLQAIKNACYLLKDNSEMDAYNHYLGIRAKWLGLDSGSPLHRTLTRVGTMLMLYNKEEGRILKESFLRLDPENLALVVEEFNINRKDHLWKLPTSLPSVLVNFSNGMLQGSSQKESLEQTIKVLAKILRCQKTALLRKETPLNFDPISKIAKDSPSILLDGELSVDESGNVILLAR